jgi:hypothetical protein
MKLEQDISVELGPRSGKRKDSNEDQDDIYSPKTKSGMTYVRLIFSLFIFSL